MSQLRLSFCKNDGMYGENTIRRQWNDIWQEMAASVAPLNKAL